MARTKRWYYANCRHYRMGNSGYLFNLNAMRSCSIFATSINAAKKMLCESWDIETSEKSLIKVHVIIKADRNTYECDLD